MFSFVAECSANMEWVGLYMLTVWLVTLPESVEVKAAKIVDELEERLTGDGKTK